MSVDVALSLDQREQAERQRLADLAAISKETDSVQCEVLFRDRFVRFDISVLEVQHLSDRELLDRYLRKAFHDVGAPAAVRADPA